MSSNTAFPASPLRPFVSLYPLMVTIFHSLLPNPLSMPLWKTGLHRLPDHLPCPLASSSWGQSMRDLGRSEAKGTACGGLITPPPCPFSVLLRFWGPHILLVPIHVLNSCRSWVTPSPLLGLFSLPLLLLCRFFVSVSALFQRSRFHSAARAPGFLPGPRTCSAPLCNSYL